MDFTFSLPGVQAEGVSCWDRVRIGELDVQSRERLRLVIDTFGKNSARSQGLSASITDMFRLQTTNHRLYLATSQASGRMVVLGGIKTGSKKLFIRVETGSFQEIEPTCVLDFYVHEDYQRQGIGKLLFEHFLAAEKQTPASVGYDRPSHKFLQFIRKHYGLAQYIPQSNNFVVFSSYFHNAASVDPTGSIWTSVSQRPLTAQKRLRSTSATAGTSLTHQQASSMPTQRRHTAAQPGVPVFRSGSDNRQLLQQQPATDTLQTGRLRQPQDNGQEYVQRCKVSGSSLGVAQEPQAVVAHQQPLISVQQPRVQQVAAAQRGLPQSLHSREAELRFGNAAQQLQMPQQAYGSQSILSPSLSSAAMCVKPPWAIDDPFQKQPRGSEPASTVSYINSPSQYKAGIPSAYLNTSGVLAGRQRSGSGAKGCMTW